MKSIYIILSIETINRISIEYILSIEYTSVETSGVRMLEGLDSQHQLISSLLEKPKPRRDKLVLASN